MLQNGSNAKIYHQRFVTQIKRTKEKRQKKKSPRNCLVKFVYMCERVCVEKRVRNKWQNKTFAAEMSENKAPCTTPSRGGGTNKNQANVRSSRR